MESLTDISIEILERDTRLLYDGYYKEFLAYVNGVYKHNDISQTLDDIGAGPLKQLITDAFTRLSEALNKTIAEMYQNAMEQDQFTPADIAKAANTVTNGAEIFNYLYENNQMLWSQLGEWHNTHQSFVTYHNTVYQEALNESHESGAIGAVVGGFFGGEMGSMLGGGLMGYLAGKSKEKEYYANFDKLNAKYKDLLSAFDNSWGLFINSHIYNLLKIANSRYNSVREARNHSHRIRKTANESKRMSDSLIVIMVLGALILIALVILTLAGVM